MSIEIYIIHCTFMIKTTPLNKITDLYLFIIMFVSSIAEQFSLVTKYC